MHLTTAYKSTWFTSAVFCQDHSTYTISIANKGYMGTALMHFGLNHLLLWSDVGSCSQLPIAIWLVHNYIWNVISY